jgi:hypothetical protein
LNIAVETMDLAEPDRSEWMLSAAAYMAGGNQGKGGESCAER